MARRLIFDGAAIEVGQLPLEGTTGITGTLSATLDDLTLTATGTLPIVGTLTVALDDLTSTATGTLALTGSLAATLDDATLSATGALALTGTLTATLEDVALAATGALPITGTLSVTLDDLTLTATGGGAGIVGELDVTLDDLTASATGALAIAGTLSATLADTTLAATGALPIVGTLAATLDDATLSSTGTLPIVGELAATLADTTLSSSGALALTGSLTATLDDLTLAATGRLAVVGTLSVTLDDLTLVSRGRVPTLPDEDRIARVLPEVRRAFAGYEQRTARVLAELRVASVASEDRVSTVRPEYRAPAEPIVLVDVSSDGTFARSGSLMYLTGAPNSAGGFAANASSNVRRLEDRGDGAGALLCVETSHSNGFLRSRDHTSGAWLNAEDSGANFVATPAYAAGIDGTMVAARLQFASAPVSSYYQARAVGLSAVSLSVWARATSGTAQLNIAVSEGGAGPLVRAAGFDLTETWQLCTLVVPTGVASWVGFSPGDTKDRTGAGVGGIAPTLPQDVLIDAPQYDSVLYPRGTIDNATDDAIAVGAESLTFAVGEYPSRLLTERAQFAEVSPMFASSGGDLPVNNVRWLLSFGGSSNGIRIIQSTSTTLVVQALAGGSVVASSGAISGVSRHGLLGAVGWDPRNGLVYVDGVAGSAGTPWSWSSSAMRVGGIYGGASEANCRLGSIEKW